ncbi:MAG: integrase arm-type DNA-binding domain-containing protein [Alphaproteobacteria bacterium]
MAKQNLNTKTARGLPFADEGQYMIRDSQVKGLAIVVGKRSRTWRVRYDGARKVNRTLGDVAVMDSDTARALAMTALGNLRAGKDEAPTAPRAPVTLAQAWASYEAALERKIASGARSGRTLASYRSVVRHHFGDWADTPLRQMSKQAGEVASWHREITDGRGLADGARGGRVIANLAARLLRAIYKHADDFDLDTADLPGKAPTRQVEFNREERRSTALGRDDMPEWNRQRLALPSIIKREFHLMMLLTGSRPDALKRARWEDVDFEAKTLHFPSPKGGEARAFKIPLSQPMIDCLHEARAAGEMIHFAQSREYIFPSGGRSGYLSDTQDAKKLSHFGGSLRQGYISAAVAAGIAERDTKTLVNHSTKGNVTAGYVDDDAIWPHLVTCQARISDYIVEGLRGTDKEQS